MQNVPAVFLFIIIVFSEDICVSFTHYAFSNKLIRVNKPDWFTTPLNLTELTQKDGYDFEKHVVITKDGYILELHRIPHGKSDKEKIKFNQVEVNKPPLLFMHGLQCASGDYLVNGKQNLAYLAAEEGYDVWLGNARGNIWGRKHVKLNPDLDDEFWDFTFHEIGIYDLPATIDYILTITNQESISYIGHSQGNTILLALLSEQPEYNKKIKIAGMLAPAAFMFNTPSVPIRFLATEFGFNSLISISQIRNEVSRRQFPLSTYTICLNSFLISHYCLKSLQFVFGGTFNHFNLGDLSLFLRSYPAGSSRKQFEHFFQLSKNNSFVNYDYGSPSRNSYVYGQETPPSYNLRNVKIPTIIYYGNNDYLVGVQDVWNLNSQLKNSIECNKVNHHNFGHMDFVWSKYAPSLVYKPLLKSMQVFVLK